MFRKFALTAALATASLGVFGASQAGAVNPQPLPPKSSSIIRSVNPQPLPPKQVFTIDSLDILVNFV